MNVHRELELTLPVGRDGEGGGKVPKLNTVLRIPTDRELLTLVSASAVARDISADLMRGSPLKSAHLVWLMKDQRLSDRRQRMTCLERLRLSDSPRFMFSTARTDLAASSA